MRGVKKLDRESIVTFLVGKGFDKEVLDLCSKEWLLEILERQITPDIPDENEPEDEQYPVGVLDDKEVLRRELELAVEEFLSSGRSVTNCKSKHVVPDGEAGLKWAKDRWPDD